jgi:hypothetical protein|uniref:Bet v I/Major latex protein domain-containing protein n=1 Tax=Globisporangium ultimum (strain ATCC 200006 / CBS 805.95 / DAOM BR144) TaxID=431595 RepID=K3WDR4_GLOUD
MSQAPSYVDPAAAQAFEAAPGNLIEIVQVVNAPVNTVFDDWLQKLWIGNFKLGAPGTGRGMVGCERIIESFDVVETIVGAALPMNDNSQTASINYAVTTFGKFTWDFHTGYVRFIPSDDGKTTTVNWSNKSTPKTNEDGTKVDDSGLRALLTKVIAGQVAEWAATYSAAPVAL